MNLRFANGDEVQYDDPFHGKGKGFVCGYDNIGNKDYFAVYPKRMIQPDDYPYMVLIVPTENLIATPFLIMKPNDAYKDVLKWAEDVNRVKLAL